MTGKIEPINKPSAAPIARAQPPGPIHFETPGPLPKPEPTPAMREFVQANVGPERHVRLPSSDRQIAGRKGVYRLDGDLYEGRIAFLSRYGPPLRGYVTTDLSPGAYSLTVDRRRKLWVISETVDSGLRFSIDLDGPEPFELEYEQPLVLAISAGGLHAWKSRDSVLDVVAALEKLKSLGRWLYLTGLNDSLLYDVIDQLWSGETYGQAIVMDLLSSFEEAVKIADDLDGIARVLRALESFSAKQADLHVNAFSTCMIDPESMEPDPEREQAGLSTLQLRLTYSKLEPVRSIVLYADDILDSDTKDADPPVYGQCGLLYPKWLSKATTPRLHEAKKAILVQLGYMNLNEVIEQSLDTFDKIQFAWTAYGLAAESIAAGLLQLKARPSRWAGSVGAARLHGAPVRWKGIELARSGPGQWVRDFEGGANMSPRAAFYQLEVAGTPPGWGYRCGGLQFENFIDGMLIDAKDWEYWGTVGRSMRGVSDSTVAMEKLRQAEEQWLVAGRAKVGLQWRVSDGQLVPVIRKAFDTHGMRQVSVIHAPARRMPVGWKPKTPSRLF